MLMKKKGGFTLIEMMIVLAIVGVLAAIALPSFMNSIREARRSDAADALLYIQQLQERYRANHTDFGSLSEIGYPNGADATVYSTDAYYVVSTTGAGSATAYTITATAASGTSQVGDTGNPVDCTTLTLTVTATDPRGTKAPAACWSN